MIVREAFEAYALDLPILKEAKTNELLALLGIKMDEELAIQHLGLFAPSLEPDSRRKAEVLQELIRRWNIPLDLTKICSPRAATAYLLPRYGNSQVEVFGILALDAKGQVLAERVIATGTFTAVAISPREVFREALRFGASSVLAFHTHPSGICDPSREDELMTKRLRSAGESLGVPLADHIVVGSDTTHSFRAAEGWDK